METSRHIVGSLGPNNNWQTGDVVIVFNPKIMRHPDFNATLVSSSSVFTLRAKTKYNWLAHSDEHAQLLGTVLIAMNSLAHRYSGLPSHEAQCVASRVPL
jgi:hypothetical protein